MGFWKALISSSDPTRRHNILYNTNYIYYLTIIMQNRVDRVGYDQVIFR